MKPYQQRKWLVLWCLRVISLSVLPPWLVWPLLLRRTMWLAPRRRQQAPAHREGWQRNCETSRGLNCLLKANMYVFNWITFLKIFRNPRVLQGLQVLQVRILVMHTAVMHHGGRHGPSRACNRVSSTYPCLESKLGSRSGVGTKFKRLMISLESKQRRPCFLPWNFLKLFFSSFLPASAQVPVSCCHAPWVADPKCKIGHANRGVTPRTKTMDSVNAWRC